MTKEEFLNGFGMTPAERERQEIAAAWAAYNWSQEARDESAALAEMECQVAPSLRLVRDRS